MNSRGPLLEVSAPPLGGVSVLRLVALPVALLGPGLLNVGGGVAPVSHPVAPRGETQLVRGHCRY